MSPRPDKRAALAVVALLAFHTAVAAAFALHGRPNIDEGMFLWAGRLVAGGAAPYRDFPFMQAPALAYAAALAPESWLGSPLLGGRALALAAGVLGMAGALALAHRLAGGLGALLTLIASLATLPLLWVGATLRAQALATPLLVLGVAALARAPRGALGWSVAPSLVLWSTGIRLTNALVLAAVCAFTAWRLRAAPRRLAAVAALVGAQAALLALPVLRAPEPALFQAITGQLTRGGRFGHVGEGALERIARLCGAYLDLLPDAALLLALALAAAALWVARARAGAPVRLDAPLGDPHSAQLALAAAGALAFAPHLALGNAFPEYLVPLWALLAPAVGIGLASELARRGASRAARGGALAAFALLAAAGAWRGADVWIGRGEASFAAFRAVAADLAARARPGCTAVSFETELVVEAGCRVLPGLEYSYFAYHAGLPTDEARRLGVANLALVRERVAALRPELVVLAPGHAHLMLGPDLTAGGGPPRAERAPGSLDPLEFLGPDARHYTLYRRARIPSGARRPGERDALPLLVYARAPAW